MIVCEMISLPLFVHINIRIVSTKIKKYIVLLILAISFIALMFASCFILFLVWIFLSWICTLFGVSLVFLFFSTGPLNA